MGGAWVSESLKCSRIGYIGVMEEEIVETTIMGLPLTGLHNFLDVPLRVFPPLFFKPVMQGLWGFGKGVVRGYRVWHTARAYSVVGVPVQSAPPLAS